MEGKSAAGEIIRSKIYPPNHPGDARGDEITGSRYRGKFRVNDERYCFSRVSGMNERTVDEGGGGRGPRRRTELRDSGNKRGREGVGGGTLLYLRRGNKSGRGYFETSLSRRNVVTKRRAFGGGQEARRSGEAPPDGARRDAAIFNYGRNGPRLCCKYVRLLNRIEN